MTLPPSSLTLLAGVSSNLAASGAEAAAAASNNAGGLGGGGRRRGVARFTAVVRRCFGTLRAAVGLVAVGCASMLSVGVAALVAVTAMGRVEDSPGFRSDGPAVGVAGLVAEGCGMADGSVFTPSSVFPSPGLLSEAFCSDVGVLGTCGEASRSLGTFWVCVGVLEPEAGGGGGASRR